VSLKAKERQVESCSYMAVWLLAASEREFGGCLVGWADLQRPPRPIPSYSPLRLGNGWALRARKELAITHTANRAERAAGRPEAREGSPTPCSGPQPGSQAAFLAVAASQAGSQVEQ